jgi:hypothetical protein
MGLRWALILSLAETVAMAPSLYAADDHTDPNLVNAWGIVFSPNAFVWIVNNGAGVSTPYDGGGNLQSLAVTISAVARSIAPCSGRD